MNLVTTQEFTGVTGNGIINAVVVGGPATLETKSAAGTWVAVPDGAITDSSIAFRAPVQAPFRFVFATGSVAIYR